MNINLTNFKKYKKTILHIIEKGNPLTESLYFDFQKGYCYFQNENQYARMRIEKAEEKNIFVSAEKFLLLADKFDDIIEYERGYFKKGEDKFKVGNYGELKLPSENFDDFITIQEYNQILNDDLVFNNFRQAINYIVFDPKDGLNAVFMRNNHIISTNTDIMFESKLEGNYPDFELQDDILKILITLKNFDTKLEYKTKEDSENIIICADSLFDIKFIKQQNLSCPPYNDPEVIEQYNHDTYFICNLHELLEGIKFISQFSEDAFKRFNLYVQKDKIKLEIQEEDSNVEKYIPLVETNITDSEKQHTFSGIDLKTGLTSLNGDSLIIKISNEEEKDLTMFQTKEDPNKKIVYLKF